MTSLVRWLLLPLLIAGVVACSDYGSARRDYEAGQYKEAFTKLLALAREGDVRAQFDVAMMYSQGTGVAMDPSSAGFWMLKAAQNGNLDAMVEIGNRFEKGMGLEKNPLMAFDWFRKAAIAGSSIGAHKLGMYYHGNKGVPQDLLRAYAWYRLANNAAARQDADLIFSRLSQQDQEKAQKIYQILSKNPAG